MLQVRNLTKLYDRTPACNDLSFDAKGGEITILAGPNGAGKSTAIKSIVGLLRFFGQITIDGHPNKSIDAKQVLGYVPEIPNLYEALTVGEHLEFIRRAYGLDQSNEPYEAELLRRFELEDKKDKVGKDLSKGMQQKVSICCALLHRPRLLLLDEPLVGLDPHAIRQLKELLGELRAGGTAILVSTHMLDSVEDLWDTVHIMMNGQIRASRTRAQIAESNESLNDLFFQITEGAPAEEAE